MLGQIDKILESVSLEVKEKQQNIEENTVVLSDTVVTAIQECVASDTLESFIENVIYETSIPVIEAKSDDDDDEDEKKDDDDEDGEKEEKKDDEEKDKKKDDDDEKEKDKKKDDDDKEEKKDDEETVEEGKKACKEAFVIGESAIDENLDIEAIIKEADANAVAVATSKEEPKKDAPKSKFSAGKIGEIISKAWASLAAVFNKALETLGDAILTVFNQDKAIAERASVINKGLPLIKNVATKTHSFENTKADKLTESAFSIFWSKVESLVSAKGAKIVKLGALSTFTPEIEKLADVNMLEIAKEATAHTIKTFTGSDATAIEGAFSAFFRGKPAANVGEFIAVNNVVENCTGSGKIKAQISQANHILDLAKSNTKFQSSTACKNANDTQVNIIKKIDNITRQGVDLEMKKNIAFLQAVRARTVASFSIAKLAIKAGEKDNTPSDSKQVGVKESTVTSTGDVVADALNSIFNN